MHVFNHMHLSRCYLLLCMLTGDWTGETQYESATLYSELGIRMMCMLRRYKRDDGLDLTATLYLPPGYDKELRRAPALHTVGVPSGIQDQGLALLRFPRAGPSWDSKSTLGNDVGFVNSLHAMRIP